MNVTGRLLRHSLCLLVFLVGSGCPAGPSTMQTAHWCRHDLYRVLRTSIPRPEGQP